MTNTRATRSAFLFAAGTLTLLMAFATDVITETVLDAPWQALALAALALAAISMSGTVISAMHQHRGKQHGDAQP
jgi:hypothetical protein